MIRNSSRTGKPILVATRIQVDNIKDTATRLKLEIPEPKTWRQVKDDPMYKQEIRSKGGALIDEGLRFLYNALGIDIAEINFPAEETDSQMLFKMSQKEWELSYKPLGEEVDKYRELIIVAKDLDIRKCVAQLIARERYGKTHINTVFGDDMFPAVVEFNDSSYFFLYGDQNVSYPLDYRFHSITFID